MAEILGELLKMRIFSYGKPDRLGLPVQMFDMMYNPNTYSVKYAVEFHDTEAQGTGGTQLKFKRVPPKDYSFEFILDGTGASDPGTLAGLAQGVPILGEVVEQLSVKLLVQRFLDVAYQPAQENHRPHYIKLLWGAAFCLDCVMTSADVTYTLINSDGTPLRAKINATFRESKEPGMWEQLLKFRSPDLTAQRQVNRGDTLPLLSDTEYDDPSYYLELARVNRVKNFRRLRVGQELNFPPLRPASES